MTDEELIAMARLAQRDDRMASGALYGDLADRIEALLEQCEGLAQVVDYNWVKHQRVIAAEAKLAKAVEGLLSIDALDPEALIGGCSREALGGLVNLMGDKARATLAEIKGENHD